MLKIYPFLLFFVMSNLYAGERYFLPSCEITRIDSSESVYITYIIPQKDAVIATTKQIRVISTDYALMNRITVGKRYDLTVECIGPNEDRINYSRKTITIPSLDDFERYYVENIMLTEGITTFELGGGDSATMANEAYVQSSVYKLISCDGLPVNRFLCDSIINRCDFVPRKDDDYPQIAVDYLCNQILKDLSITSGCKIQLYLTYKSDLSTFYRIYDSYERLYGKDTTSHFSDFNRYPISSYSRLNPKLKSTVTSIEDERRERNLYESIHGISRYKANTSHRCDLLVSSSVRYRGSNNVLILLTNHSCHRVYYIIVMMDDEGNPTGYSVQKGCIILPEKEKYYKFLFQYPLYWRWYRRKFFVKRFVVPDFESFNPQSTSFEGVERDSNAQFEVRPED